MTTEVKMEEDRVCEPFQCTSEIVLETDMIKVEVGRDYKYEKNGEDIEMTCESSNCMVNWRGKEEERTPADFLDLLYHDKVEHGETSDDVLEIESDEDEQNSCDASLDKSRSPIDFSSELAALPAVGVRTFKENSVAQEYAKFLAPDAQKLCVAPEERDRYERSRRSKQRGVRGVQVHDSRWDRSESGHPSQDWRGEQRWRVGHPLNEVWTRDEDVPPELINLEMDVRTQQMRLPNAERNTVLDNDSESEDEVEFIDASDGEDSLPRLEGQNLHFEWSSMETFQSQEENFKPESTGSVHVFDSAYDAFRSYWSDDVISVIVTEMNQYATKISSAAFQSEWTPTNCHEILCLFAFWMMLGTIRMPTITSCFSVDPLLKTEIFRRIFTRRRYENLCRALQFVESNPVVNNTNPSNTSAGSSDRLHHLRPIIDHLNTAFQSNYVLSKDIYIDESVTLWKGKLSCRQYNRNKASKFGIKTFELCESTTGYVWSFIVDTGDLNSTSIVKELIGPLLNKGYRLFMGSWYNSPSLAVFLKLNGTDCVGTLESSRCDIPVIINKAPPKRGEYIARHFGDVTILSWQDNERVTMISTCHGSSTALPTVYSIATSRPVPFKPQMVLDYNKFKGGVHLKDQILEPYLLKKKRPKWCIKLLKRFLNFSILNSRILLQSSTNKHQDHLSFRLQLVDTILTNHLQLCPQSRKVTVGSGRSTVEPADRLVDSSHWPILLDPTEGSIARNRKFMKRCLVCLHRGKKSQKSRYCCETCRVPLCVVFCFKEYHTSPHLYY